MPQTTLSDVFIPEVFASYQEEGSVLTNAFSKSGILVNNAFLNSFANNAGNLATIPYWLPIDSTSEPTYPNDVYTDIAVPDKVSSNTLITRISELNKGFSSSDLVAPLSGSDPLKFVSSHIDGWWAEQLQRRLLAASIGLYNDNVAGTGDMVLNVGVSDTASVTEAMRFNATNFVNTVLTLGDRLNDIKTIAVHSVVYAKMITDDMITFIKDSDGTTDIPQYLGRRVVVDDGLTVFPGTGANPKLTYLSVLFGANVFGLGIGSVKVPSEFQRAPERGLAGGFETLWSRKKWIIHPAGYDFTSATVSGPGLSPTWADLKLAANWTRKFNRKHIPLAFLVTNG